MGSLQEFSQKWRTFLQKPLPPASSRWNQFLEECRGLKPEDQARALRFEILVEKAKAFSQEKDWEGARELYEAVLKEVQGKFPQDPQEAFQVCRAWINRGITLSRLGHLTQALAELEAVQVQLKSHRDPKIQGALVVASRFWTFLNNPDDESWRDQWLVDLQKAYEKGRFRGGEGEILTSILQMPSEEGPGLPQLLGLVWPSPTAAPVWTTQDLESVQTAYFSQTLTWRRAYLGEVSEKSLPLFWSFRRRDPEPLWSWERSPLKDLAPPAKAMKAEIQNPRSSLVPSSQPVLAFSASEFVYWKDASHRWWRQGLRQPPQETPEPDPSLVPEDSAHRPQNHELLSLGRFKLQLEEGEAGQWTLRGAKIKDIVLDSPPEKVVYGEGNQALVLMGNRVLWLKDSGQGALGIESQLFPQGLLVAALHKDGTRAAVSDKKNRIHLWHWKGAVQKLLGGGEWACALAFTGDNVLWSGHLGGGTAFWSLKDPQICTPFLPWPVKGLGRWNDDSWTLLLSRNLVRIDQDRVLSFLWNPSDSLVSASQSEGYILGVTARGHLRVYALGQEKPHREAQIQGLPQLTAISSQGDWAVFCEGNLWTSWGDPLPWPHPVAAMIWIPGGLVLSGPEGVHFWNGAQVTVWESPGFEVLSWKRDTDRDGLWGLGESSLAFWSAPQGEILWILRTHQRGLHGLALKDGNLLIRLGHQKMLYWQEPFEKGSYELEVPGGRWDQWLVLSDAPFVVSAGEGVRLWSWPELQPVAKLSPLRRTWSGLDYNEKTQTLAALTSLGELLVWKLREV